jgi:hypothetical protein
MRLRIHVQAEASFPGAHDGGSQIFLQDDPLSDELQPAFLQPGHGFFVI